jgi:hypothetical protein
MIEVRGGESEHWLGRRPAARHLTVNAPAIVRS